MEKMGTLMFKTHGEGVGVANCQKKNLKERHFSSNISNGGKKYNLIGAYV